MDITDHAFGVHKNSATPKGFQCKSAFGVTNKARFGTREVIDGSRARAKRASWEKKRHIHEAADNRTGRFLGAPGFATEFTIKTGCTLWKRAGRGVSNGGMDLFGDDHGLDN